MTAKLNLLFSDVQALRRAAADSPKYNDLSKLQQVTICRQLVKDLHEKTNLHLDLRFTKRVLSDINPAILNGRISPTSLIPIQQALTSWFMTHLASALAQTASNRTINI